MDTHIDVRDIRTRPVEGLGEVVVSLYVRLEVLGEDLPLILRLAPPDEQDFIPVEQLSGEILAGWARDLLGEDPAPLIEALAGQSEEYARAPQRTRDPETGEQTYTRREGIPRWRPGVAWQADDLVYHEWTSEPEPPADGEPDPGPPALQRNYFRVVQGHTSQADWPPHLTPSLFTVARFFGEGEEIADWVQPTGAHDAYSLGDKVRHNGQIWESAHEANVWEPPTLWNPVTD